MQRFLWFRGTERLKTAMRDTCHDHVLDLGLLFPDKFQNPLSCFGAKIIHALVNGGEANGVTNLPAVWLVYGQINVTSLVYPTSFEQTLGCIYFERRLILVCAIYR